MTRRLHLLFLAIGVVLLHVVPTSAGEPQYDLQDGAAKPPPLWRALPTQQFATLDAGKTKGLSWGIYTYRGHSKSTVCIEEVHLSARGSFGKVQSCGPLEPSAGVPHVYTLFGSVENEPNKVRKSVTNIGIVFDTNVAEVKVDLGYDVERVLETKRLGAYQARKARVPRFRFVTLSLRSQACLRSIIGFDKAGTRLFSDTNIERGCSG